MKITPQMSSLTAEKLDALMMNRPIIKNRICDDQADCPDAIDETGELSR